MKLTDKVSPVGHPTVGSKAGFKLSSTVPSGDAVTTFSINFGDHAKVVKGKKLPKTITHAFGRTGRFTVTLTVTDKRHKTVKASTKVLILAAPAKGGATTTTTQAPPTASSTLDLVAPAQTLMVGSSATIAAPAPLLTVTSVDPAAAAGGVTSQLSSGGVELDVAMTASPATEVLTVSGAGCTGENACGVPFRLHIPVSVTALTTAPPQTEAFTAPTSARIATGTALVTGGAQLPDELLVTLGSPDSPGTLSQAEQLAAAEGAVVTGGLADVGIYQLRWSTPQDLAAKKADLLELPGVTSVAFSDVGIAGANALPPELTNAPSKNIWWFNQIRAQQAWDISTGSDVTVGIVDVGVPFGAHPDLNVTSLGGAIGVAQHATDVAGLVCAKANSQGSVGIAWGCPIVAAATDAADSDTSELAAMDKIVTQSDAKVANISLGINVGGGCMPSSKAQQVHDLASNDADAYRQFFQGVGRNIVWTLSAGNICDDRADSGAAQSFDLPNVITVAATNSDDNLSSFSNFGPQVEVAAPGGVGVGADGDGTQGPLSTFYDSCFVFFKCSTYSSEMFGTSMAAPLVAGIAALVRSAHPSMSADQVGACITSTAGNGTGDADFRSSLPSGFTGGVPFTGSIPIANAQAAVQCTGTGTGVVRGTVTDASTGQGIAGAQVILGTHQTTTGDDGTYSIGGLPAGTVAVTVNAVGYQSQTDTAVIVGTGTTTENLTLAPGDAPSDLVTLSWGSVPRDIDLHLSGPDGQGGRFHAAYFDKNPVPFVSQDVDDTTGDGTPETDSISQDPDTGQFVPGEYHIWVHNYSGEASFTGSGARVVISGLTGPVASISLADATGDPSQRIWLVADFTIDANGAVRVTSRPQSFTSGDQNTIF